MRITIIAAFAIALAACGHHDDECEGHSHDPVCLVCDGSEDPMTPGEVFSATNGFTIELVSATPTPFVGSDSGGVLNEMVVRIRKDGTLVDGVDFNETQTFYPVGGHGSPLRPVAAAGATTGEYDLTTIHFLHAGHWELRFSLTLAGVTGTYNLPLCIEEAPGA